MFVSVANRDKRAMIFPVKRLADLGFEIVATEGTAEVLRRNGVEATVVRKHSAGPRPGRRADHRRADPRRRGRPGRQHAVRAAAPAPTATRSASAAVAMDRPIITTVQELAAAVQGIEALGRGELGVRSLQELDAAAATP